MADPDKIKDLIAAVDNVMDVYEDEEYLKGAEAIDRLDAAIAPFRVLAEYQTGDTNPMRAALDAAGCLSLIPEGLRKTVEVDGVPNLFSSLAVSINNLVTQYKRSHETTQYSDQMVCSCGARWDVNDPNPPEGH